MKAGTLIIRSARRSSAWEGPCLGCEGPRSVAWCNRSGDVFPWSNAKSRAEMPCARPWCLPTPDCCSWWTLAGVILAHWMLLYRRGRSDSSSRLMRLCPPWRSSPPVWWECPSRPPYQWFLGADLEVPPLERHHSLLLVHKPVLWRCWMVLLWGGWKWACWIQVQSSWCSSLQGILHPSCGCRVLHGKKVYVLSL